MHFLNTNSYFEKMFSIGIDLLLKFTTSVSDKLIMFSKIRFPVKLIKAEFFKITKRFETKLKTPLFWGLIINTLF